jgi:hypothetical protein
VPNFYLCYFMPAKGNLPLLRAMHENVHHYQYPTNVNETSSDLETANAVEVQKKDDPVSGGEGKKSALALSRVCSIAEKAGHLDCLQYAHEHGCP